MASPNHNFTSYLMNMLKFLKIKNLKLKINLGFTLLELLVVIGIIAIITSMGFVSYSTSQKKARDAKRRGDLEAIQNALEQYYSICNYSYPSSISSGIVCSTIAPTVTIMSTVPVDPKTTTPYPTPKLNPTEYQICSYNMEVGPTGYCVTNKQ